MKIEAILKNIIFLDNGYFKYQEYQNLGIHSIILFIEFILTYHI